RGLLNLELGNLRTPELPRRLPQFDEPRIEIADQNGARAIAEANRRSAGRDDRRVRLSCACERGVEVADDEHERRGAWILGPHRNRLVIEFWISISSTLIRVPGTRAD